MAETLTVLRLGVPPTLARTLRSTNADREHDLASAARTRATSSAGATGRWRCAGAPPGMVEAGKQFRRVNGHLHLRSLRDTLDKVTEPVGATGHDETVNAA